MREASYYVLAALLDGPGHGYAMLEKIRGLTGGRVNLTTGTLYGTLDRLVDQEMIHRAGSEIVNGRARQYFEITDKGSGAVQFEAERLSQAAAAVEDAIRSASAKQRQRRPTRPLRRPAAAPGMPTLRPGLVRWSLAVDPVL